MIFARKKNQNQVKTEEESKSTHRKVHENGPKDAKCGFSSAEMSSGQTCEDAGVSRCT